MNATSMYNLTDEELIRHVDRTNPEIDELCARLEETNDQLEEANHFSSILVTRLEEAKAEIELLDPKANQEKK